MKKLIFIFAFLTGVMGSANASLLTVSSFVGDAVFNSICNLGTSNNQECERAIGEFRSGGGGTYEQSLNTPTQFGAVTEQFIWGNGEVETFSLSYDGIGVISLDLSGQTISMSNPTNSYVGLTGANSMFIRIRNDNADDTLTLSNMFLNGMAVGGLAFDDLLDDGNNVGAGSSGAGYLRLDGFDFGQAWSLTGEISLSWTGSIPNQSRLNANFKVTELPTEVPAPAIFSLLLIALGGIALRKIN